MYSRRNQALGKLVVTGGLFLTMSMSVIACAASADRGVADAVPMPIGDWWPAGSSGALRGEAKPGAEAPAAMPEFALGDWWPDAGRPEGATALAAAPAHGEPLPVARNGR